MLFNGLVRQSGIHSRPEYVGDSGNGVEWSFIAIILAVAIDATRRIEAVRNTNA
jgi:hypothetical protein